MSENNHNERREHRDRHRSVFFPALLILLGVFFLLSNLDLIPGNAWSLVVRFWPLLFVVGGLDDLINRKWAGAVINFGLGTILLLGNLGYFPWTAWQMIWRLWPVFIIAIGLDIAFRGQSVFGSLIGVSIAVLIVAAIAWFVLQGPLAGTAETSEVRYALQGASEVDVVIKPAVGVLRLEAEALDDQLVSGEVATAESEDFYEDYEVSDGQGRLTLSSEGVVFFPSHTQSSGFPWDLTLNDEIPMVLTVEQGVGQQVIDLQGLDLSSFDVNLGVGQLELTLPDEEVFDADLELAIGELVVRVPEGLLVRIELDTAITGTDFPSDFTQENDTIYSPGAKDGSEVSVLRLSNPIGAVRILSID